MSMSKTWFRVGWRFRCRWVPRWRLRPGPRLCADMVTWPWWRFRTRARQTRCSEEHCMFCWTSVCSGRLSRSRSRSHSPGARERAVTPYTVSAGGLRSSSSNEACWSLRLLFTCTRDGFAFLPLAAAQMQKFATVLNFCTSVTRSRCQGGVYSPQCLWEMYFIHTMLCICAIFIFILNRRSP